MEEFVEKKQKDNLDRGEVRTIFSRSHSDIKLGGKTMCTKHSFKKLSENEVYCTNCPTCLIVNPDVLETYL